MIRRTNLELSACIVVYNGCDEALKAAQTVLQYTRRHPLTLYLVDNASPDGSGARLEAAVKGGALSTQPGQKVEVRCRKENGGFGTGHNTVLPELTSDYHFILNPDIQLTADTLSDLADWMAAHPDAVMARPGHHSIRVGGHPVGQIAEGISGELDVRVQDEVIVARQLRQDSVVSGAETAVLLAAAHLDLLAGLSAQSAALHGGFQTCAAAVGAGVVHQIEGQRVAAGVLQHRLRRLEGFVAAVIDNDTGREFQVRSPYHSSGNIFRLKSSRWMSKLGLVQGSPAASRSPQRA